MLLNLAYLLVVAVAFPWLLYKSITTGKYRRGLWAKLSGAAFLRGGNRPCAWFHGVSVGEIHLLRQVVAEFRRRHPDWECVVSTTTDTGFVEARRCFADLMVFYWPLDFTWAVRRALDHVRPSLVVLSESELWPNFLLAAKQQGVPIAIINGRMSPRSCARFFKIRWLARKLFGRIDLIAAQTEEFAHHYRLLGAAQVAVTGNVKYDGACMDRNQPRTLALRQLLGISEDNLVWVAGSTQAPEEEFALAIFGKVRDKFPQLKLILVPRQKDRFDEVAYLLECMGASFVRRSQMAPGEATTSRIILVDTIGELGAIWGRADLAYVGGSLDGKRGGQNMIEPAAYGAAVLFGPHTWNFKDPVRQLLEREAAVQIENAEQLEQAVLRLLEDANLRQQLGERARQFVLTQQGATDRTLTLLDTLLPAASERTQAA